MKKIILAAIAIFLFIGILTANAAVVNLNWVYDTVADTFQPVKNAVNARIMASSFHATSTATSSTFVILNDTWYADYLPNSYSDIGAKVMAAYAALPAEGGKIVITASSTFSTPMLFTTANKHVKLECDPGVVLNYTGTGSSTVFATFQYPDYPTDAGIDGCTFDGPSGSTVVGVSLGNSTGGAAGYKFKNITIQDFGLAVASGPNTYLTTFEDFVIQNNARHLHIYPASNSGENLRFANGLFGDCKSIPSCVYAATSSTASLQFVGVSFDNVQVVVAPSNFNTSFVGGHFENPASAGAVIAKYPFLINGGETTSLDGVSFINMATTTERSPDPYIVNTGYLSLSNVSAWSNNSLSATAFVSNSASANLNTFGFNEIGTSIDVVATSSIGFFTGDNNRVGIGTTSPAGLFDVNGDAFIGSSTGTTKLTMRAGSGRNAVFGQDGASSVSAAYIDSNGAIDFRTDGASKMFMTDLGLVGIGTTNPGTLLTVAGTTTLATTTVTDLTISRGLRDSGGNLGTAGQVLQTTGTSSRWVSTSTLGITGGGGATSWGSITGTLSSQTDLQTALDAKLSTTTGNWAGTLGGLTLANILARANHTGTQLAATISDFVATVRSSISESITGIAYNSGTGDFSLDSGYVISTTTRETNQDTAFSWGNHATAGYAVGPVSATDNAVARFDLTTGKLIQSSVFTVSDTGNVVTGDGTGSPTLTINGGSTRAGVITVTGSSANAPLRIGSNGALQLEVDTIPRITIGEFGDVVLGATTTMPTTTISRLTIGSDTGLLKSTSGLVSTATAGTDYVANVTGDWTGTFDGIEGSAYLSRSNHTGTQSSTTITGLGTLAGFSTVPLTTHVTDILPEANGGTNQSTYTTGDILYASGANTLTKRNIGSLGNVLSVVGGVPTWVSTSSLNIAGGGGVTDPLTTDGDIIARISGSTTRLPQGSNGQFLGVSGGVLGYYTPSGSGSNWTLSGSNLSYTNGNVAIGTTSASGARLTVQNDTTQLSLISSSSADFGTNVEMYHNSATPSAGADYQQMTWYSNNSSLQKKGQFQFFSVMSDITPGSEDSYTNFRVMSNGTLSTRLTMDQFNVGVLSNFYVTEETDLATTTITGNLGIGTSSNLTARQTIQGEGTDALLRLFDNTGAKVMEVVNTAITYFYKPIQLLGALIDSYGSTGDIGDRLVSTGTSTRWVNHRGYIEGIEDFITETSNAGDAPWAESITGTGAACTNAAIATANRPGMSNCTTGTTATGRAGHMTGLTAFALGQGTTTYEGAIRITTLSNGTERYSLRIGFQDTAAAAQVDGAYILYDEGGVSTGSAASANFQCVTASNSTRTYTTTGTAVATATWYDVKIVVNRAGTSVDFYINDTVVCTHTTDIPTGTARAVGHGVQMLKSIGTTARTYDVDYHFYNMMFTTPR